MIRLATVSWMARLETTLKVSIFGVQKGTGRRRNG